MVEIVSPGSLTLDRFAKPALYAETGIPFFWRLEMTDGLEVHTHQLDEHASAYVETGVFTSLIDVAQPLPIRIPPGRLMPRHYRPELDGLER